MADFRRSVQVGIDPELLQEGRQALPVRDQIDGIRNNWRAGISWLPLSYLHVPMAGLYEGLP